MSPLRVIQNTNQLLGIARYNHPVKLPNGDTVNWTEKEARAWIKDQNYKTIREVSLSKIGDSSSWNIEVLIPPIEAGESATPVRRPIRIERI